MPRTDTPSSQELRLGVADQVRRAAADMALAARRLDAVMTDRLYGPKMLTDQTRADLADVRDRLNTILGSSR